MRSSRCWSWCWARRSRSPRADRPRHRSDSRRRRSRRRGEHHRVRGDRASDLVGADAVGGARAPRHRRDEPAAGRAGRAGHPQARRQRRRRRGRRRRRCSALWSPRAPGSAATCSRIYYSAKDRKLLRASTPAAGRRRVDAGVLRAARLRQGDRDAAERRQLDDRARAPSTAGGELQKRFGNLTLQATCSTPAARDRRAGLRRSPSASTADWQRQRREAARATRTRPRVFLRDGKAPAALQHLPQPGLARAFRLLQSKGRDAFYKGDIARAIVDKIKRAAAR